MVVQPYLFFDGRCEEAIEFYKKALGATVDMLMRFKDSPDQSMVSPASKDKVMHSTIRIGDSIIMASDGDCKGQGKFAGFSLSLTPGTEADAKRIFTGLSEGGAVRMPLTKTFFSPCFGMLADKFGIGWMIMVPGNA
jgi:PhnB protein